MNNSEFPRVRAWALHMHERHGLVVLVTMTRNRRSMIRVRQDNARVFDLRLHRAFEHAPEGIFHDMEAYLARNDRNAWARIGDFARAIPTLDPPPPPPPRRIVLTPRGRVHDLDAVLAQVKSEFFHSELEAHITWGRAPRRNPRRKRRSIRFASWNEEQRLIRVHPALDREWVPGEFLHYLVYHELCHAVAKPRQTGANQRAIHHREFRELERQYPRLEEMERLSKKIFDRVVAES